MIPIRKSDAITFFEDKAVTVSRPFVVLAGLLVALVLLTAVALAGCGSSEATLSPTTVASTATTGMSEARAIFMAGSGTPGAQVNEVTLTVEVARTPKEKNLGLMGRKEIAPDHGMAFVWEVPVNVPFWMKDTLLPLSIAFISAEGIVLDIQEMAPQTLDHHSPGKTYTKAIEANQGFYTNHGIKAGDSVRFEGL